MKNVFKTICECKKEIKGFSQKHLEKNLKIHKLLSREHKERMKIIKKFPEVMFIYNMNDDEIAKELINHPIMIEDIKSIGG